MTSSKLKFSAHQRHHSKSKETSHGVEENIYNIYISDKALQINYKKTESSIRTLDKRFKQAICKSGYLKANKQMKRCSTSLVIRKIQVKISVNVITNTLKWVMLK